MWNDSLWEKNKCHERKHIYTVGYACYEPWLTILILNKINSKYNKTYRLFGYFSDFDLYTLLNIVYKMTSAGGDVLILSVGSGSMVSGCNGGIKEVWGTSFSSEVFP